SRPMRWPQRLRRPTPPRSTASSGRCSRNSRPWKRCAPASTRSRCGRSTPSAPRARCPFTPKRLPSCAAIAWPPRRHQDRTMTTISPPTLTPSVTNSRDALEHLSQAGLLEAMLNEAAQLRRWLKFDSDFVALAHRHQEPPAAANNGGPWTTWLMLGGRGAGKTRAGAEWLRAQALGL